MSVIILDSVSKNYSSEGKNHKALDGISLKIEKGALIAVTGPSGSGKTTLLNLIAALDFPTEGEVHVDDFLTSQLSGKHLQKFRNEIVGVIFQQFFLVDHLTVFENTMVPLLPRDLSTEEKDTLVLLSLAKVGLDEKLRRFPSQLSGGELQRLAIARGLVGDQSIILADEPTGNLDFKTGLEIIDLLAEQSRQEHKTVLLATHDPRVLDHIDGIAYLDDGALSRVEGKSIQTS